MASACVSLSTLRTPLLAPSLSSRRQHSHCGSRAQFLAGDGAAGLHTLRRPLRSSANTRQWAVGRTGVVTVTAEYSRGSGGRGGAGDFLAGFVVGGAIFGALGFLFAPQISKSILGENEDGSTRKLPKWLGEDDSLEATRRRMNEKLAELNRAIDRTSAEILGEDTEEPVRMQTTSKDPNSIDAV